MKKELRLLNIIGTKIDLSYFYTISIWRNEIILQGECTSEKLALLKKLGLAPVLHECGWIEMKKGCVKISLTFNP
jgi:hypothetical protein